MISKSIKCKVYLEGYEIPFNSIEIQEQIGAPAQAVITFPPAAEFMYLLPKTLVHVFYTDSVDTNYYLIFEGQLAGVGMQKTGMNKGIQLTFISYSCELDRTPLKSWSITPTIVDSTLMITRSDKSVVNLPTQQISTAQLVDGSGLTENQVKSLNLDYSRDFAPASIMVLFLNALRSKNYNGVAGALNLFFTEAVGDGPYYNFINTSLRLANRRYIADNKVDTAVISLASLAEVLYGGATGGTENSAASKLLRDFLSFLGYDTVELGAPTYKDSSHIYNYFLKPAADYFLPMMCNVLLPYEISQMQFTRSMEAEPTRLLMYTNPIGLPNDNFIHMNLGVYSFLVPTECNMQFETGKPLKIGLTPEEKYRGITASTAEYSSNLEQLCIAAKGDYAAQIDAAEADKKPADTQAPAKPADEMVVGNINNVAYPLTDLYFRNKRLDARMCEVVTTYSPHRMVGFPGMFIDRTLPSVWGVFSAITSRISADGSATQNISVRRPKLITRNSSGDLAMLINDMMPEFPSIYEAALYAPNNIGEKIYAELTGKTGDMSIYQILKSKDPKNTSLSNSATIIQTALDTVLKDLDAIPEEEQYYKLNGSMFTRSLVEESKFWKFLLNANTPSDHKTPVYSSNSLTSDPTKFGNQASIYKPFVSERQYWVFKVVSKLNEGPILV